MITWWHQQMETFSAFLALCERNPSVTGVFPSQRPVTWSFDIFFELHLNKRLGQQSRRRWFETPTRSLWRTHLIIMIWRSTNILTIIKREMRKFKTQSLIYYIRMTNNDLFASTSNYELKSQLTVYEHTYKYDSEQQLLVYECMSLRQKDFLKLIFPPSTNIPKYEVWRLRLWKMRVHLYLPKIFETWK